MIGLLTLLCDFAILAWLIGTWIYEQRPNAKCCEHCVDHIAKGPQ